jgi:hypothetical protein
METGSHTGDGHIVHIGELYGRTANGGPDIRRGVRAANGYADAARDLPADRHAHAANRDFHSKGYGNTDLDDDTHTANFDAPTCHPYGVRQWLRLHDHPGCRRCDRRRR